MSNYTVKLTLALGLLVVLRTSQAICEQQQQPQQQQQQQQQQPQQNQPITQTGQTAAVSSSAQAPVSVPSSLSSSSAAGSAASSAPANTNANAIIISSSSNDDKPKQAQEWPMVTVDGQANKSTVDVHVPVFFDMVNHADKELGKSKLDLSVLQGLVTVNKDKTRDANGDMTGPVKVTVFGIPVYSGKGTSSYFASSSSPTSSSSSGAAAAAAASASAGGNSSPQASQENTIDTRRGGLASRAEDTASMLTNKVQKVNDKMISSLSDIFERFSTALRRTGSSLASSGVDSAGQLKIEQERANVARIQSQAPAKAESAQVSVV